MHAVAKAPAGALESQVVSKSLEDDQEDSLEKENPSPASVRIYHPTKDRAKDAGQGENRCDNGHVFANLL